MSVSVVPFGPGIDIWRSCRFIGAYDEVSLSCCQVGWVGLCLAQLVLIIAVCGILVGKSVVMGLLLDHVRVLLCIFWMSFWLFLGTLLVLGVLYLLVLFPLRYCSTRFARMTPSWRLPVFGSVSNLVAAYSDAGHRVAVDEVDRDVFWVSGSGSW